jgi:hypothetical protein
MKHRLVGGRNDTRMTSGPWSASLLFAAVSLVACGSADPRGEATPAASPTPHVGSLAGVNTQIPPNAVRLPAPTFGAIGSANPMAARPNASSDPPATRKDTTSVTEALAQPGVAACTAYNVSNPNHGPVITTPRINLLFWGTYDAAKASSITNAWQQLASAPAFYSREAEYGVQGGSFGQRLPDYVGGATGNLSDCQLVGGLADAINQAHMAPNSNDLFVVLLPTGTTSSYDRSFPAFGHHASYAWNGFVGSCTAPGTGTTYPLNINGSYVNLRYAIVESEVDPYLNVTVSHEIAEATTNPDGGSYGPDIGDMCEDPNQYNSQNPYNYIGGVMVQKIWSQNACRCVGERDLNLVGLGGANSVPTVYRPSNATVWPDGSPYYFPLFPGNSPVSPFAWDHDGDGFPDYAAFYNGSSPYVTTRLSMPPYYENTYYFGSSGDRFVPGDYDGDGISDLAVWEPSTGNWIVQYSSTGAIVTTQWGTGTDIPVPGDYDADGKTDYAVMRIADQNLYEISSSNGMGYWANFPGITAGDIPTPGDFNGDGYTDLALWRPSTGTWYVNYIWTGIAWSMQWGQNGDMPVARDYDGDWLTDLAVWRPSNGTWYFIYSSTWTTNAIQWGASTDVPVQRFTATGGF